MIDQAPRLDRRTLSRSVLTLSVGVPSPVAAQNRMAAVRTTIQRLQKIGFKVSVVETTLGLRSLSGRRQRNPEAATIAISD